MDDCKRCGFCCHYKINGIRLKCRYLITFKSGRTYCRIYKNRLGTVIFKDKNKVVLCVERIGNENLPCFEGCPLSINPNSQNKPTDSDLKSKN